MICGAVEPRKNHRLLIEVWRELIRRYDDKTPKLIVAGSPGFASQEIIREMTDDSLRPHILLASGLSSPAMAQLMAGARGVLMPSFIEGFGLPPGEALSVGTPALVSDIPAHREAVGLSGEFLPPKNPDPWVDSIEKLVDDTYFLARRAAAHAFKPRRWDDYMRDVTAVLMEEKSNA